MRPGGRGYFWRGHRVNFLVYSCFIVNTGPEFHNFSRATRENSPKWIVPLELWCSPSIHTVSRIFGMDIDDFQTLRVPGSSAFVRPGAKAELSSIRYYQAGSAKTGRQESRLSIFVKRSREIKQFRELEHRANTGQDAVVTYQSSHCLP